MLRARPGVELLCQCPGSQSLCGPWTSGGSSITGEIVRNAVLGSTQTCWISFSGEAGQPSGFSQGPWAVPMLTHMRRTALAKSPSRSLMKRPCGPAMSLTLGTSLPLVLVCLSSGLLASSCLRLSLLLAACVPVVLCHSVSITRVVAWCPSVSWCPPGPGHPPESAPAVPDDPGHRRLLLRLHAPRLHAPQLHRLRLRTPAGQRHGECGVPSSSLGSRREGTKQRAKHPGCTPCPPPASQSQNSCSGWG